MLEGLYCNMTSLNFWSRDWAVLEVTWNRKVYLLNRSAISM